MTVVGEAAAAVWETSQKIFRPSYKKKGQRDHRHLSNYKHTMKQD
jgi:hypothetical protein